MTQLLAYVILLVTWILSKTEYMFIEFNSLSMRLPSSLSEFPEIIFPISMSSMSPSTVFLLF